jgi:hypothetical protein
LSALGRASTLSLGSIAFGSLIVTLLELLKMVLRAAEHSANADGHRKSLACRAVLTFIHVPFQLSRRAWHVAPRALSA